MVSPLDKTIIEANWVMVPRKRQLRHKLGTGLRTGWNRTYKSEEDTRTRKGCTYTVALSGE